MRDTDICEDCPYGQSCIAYGCGRDGAPIENPAREGPGGVPEPYQAVERAEENGRAAA